VRGRPGAGAGAGAAGRHRWRLGIRRITRRGGFLRFMSDDLFVFAFLLLLDVGCLVSFSFFLSFQFFIATCDIYLFLFSCYFMDLSFFLFAMIYLLTRLYLLYVFYSTDPVCTPATANSMYLFFDIDFIFDSYRKQCWFFHPNV